MQNTHSQPLTQLPPRAPVMEAVERRIELRPAQAVSVPARPGTLVQCERGPVWLTQEGQIKDYILLEGMQFVSASRGTIVLSAVDGAAQLLVYPADFAKALGLGPGLHIGQEVIERGVREARHAQTAEIHRMLAWVVTSAWCAILAIARRLGFAPRRTC